MDYPSFASSKEPTIYLPSNQAHSIEHQNREVIYTHTHIYTFIEISFLLGFRSSLQITFKFPPTLFYHAQSLITQDLDLKTICGNGYWAPSNKFPAHLTLNIRQTNLESFSVYFCLSLTCRVLYKKTKSHASKNVTTKGALCLYHLARE